MTNIPISEWNEIQRSDSLTYVEHKHIGQNDVLFTWTVKGKKYIETYQLIEVEEVTE